MRGKRRRRRFERCAGSWGWEGERVEQTAGLQLATPEEGEEEARVLAAAAAKAAAAMPLAGCWQGLRAVMCCNSTQHHVQDFLNLGSHGCINEQFVRYICVTGCIDCSSERADYFLTATILILRANVVSVMIVPSTFSQQSFGRYRASTDST